MEGVGGIGKALATQVSERGKEWLLVTDTRRASGFESGPGRNQAIRASNELTAAKSDLIRSRAGFPSFRKMKEVRELAGSVGETSEGGQKQARGRNRG